MTCFADTSFLLALIADDDHTASAERWTKANATFCLTSDLVIFETTNAIRSLHLRRILDAEEVRESRRTLNSLLRQQSLLSRPLRPRLLTAEAYRLLDHFSPDLPHGAFDVLHVAAARLLKADTLVSFDNNQRILAKAAGLKVAPR